LLLPVFLVNRDIHLAKIVLLGTFRVHDHLLTVYCSSALMTALHVLPYSASLFNSL